MGDILSVRMDEQLTLLIEEFIKNKRIEKSEVIRQLIVKGIYMDVLQDYLAHKILIQKVAALVNMSLSDFMDFLGKLGIGSQLEMEDILQGYEHLIGSA